MNRKARRMAAVCIAACASAAPGAMAQAGAASRAAAKEVIEALGRRAATQGAEEATAAMARVGGEAAVRETVERAVAEGGEALAGRIAALVERHGVEGLLAVRSAPAGTARAVVEAVDAMPGNLVKQALAALAREGDGPALAALVARTGKDALEAAALQPGVGAGLVASLGDDGVRLARALSPGQAISAARHAEAIAALPAAERAGVTRLLLAQPARMASFLDKHPRFFLIAGAGAVFLANSEKFLGGAAEMVIGPDGKPMLLQPEGWLERAVVKPALAWLLPVAAGLLMAWGGLKLCFVLLRERSGLQRVR